MTESKKFVILIIFCEPVPLSARIGIYYAQLSGGEYVEF